MKNNSVKALFVVVNAGFAAEVIDIARSAGAKGATVINARGGGLPHKSFMGITIDTEKEILLLVVESEAAETIMAAIDEKAGFHSPAHSLCITVPVEKTTRINDFSHEG